MSFFADLAHALEHSLDVFISDMSGERPTADHKYSAQQNSVEINGVAVPMLVARQLRELGIPLESYTSGELHAAIHACSHDSRLIDDPEGAHFLDKLSRDSHEEEHDNLAPSKRTMSHRIGGRITAPEQNWAERVSHEKLDPQAQSFCERLMQERLHAQDEHQHLHAAS